MLESEALSARLLNAHGLITYVMHVAAVRSSKERAA
jgi:hypothetical protein